MTSQEQKLFEKIQARKIDYSLEKENGFTHLINNEEYDINIIIGVRGRGKFLEPLIESFKKAIKFQQTRKIILTIVEHSYGVEHFKIIKKHKDINYLWTKGNMLGMYSRSFVYNYGYKFSNKAKYYLLHDVDILVKENFFIELFENFNESMKCIQPYGKRRVLYMNKELTDRVISKQIDFNQFNEYSDCVSLPSILGSKGGSFFITKELFEDVGGFDPEIFSGYAAEDQFFWEKVNTMVNIKYADNPPIDMFHMWHEHMLNTNPLLYEMENDWLMFKNMNKENKLELIKLKKELLSEANYK